MQSEVKTNSKFNDLSIVDDYENFNKNTNKNQIKYNIKIIKYIIFTLTLTCFALLIAIIATSVKDGKTIRHLREENKALSVRVQSRDLIDWQEYQITKRYWWWAIGALVGLTNQAFSFYGLATACRDFSQSKGNAASCIWGAILSAIMIGGIGWKGWQTVDAINTALTNNGVSISPFSKRDEILANESIIKEVLANVSVSGYPGITLVGWTWMSDDHEYYNSSTINKREVTTKRATPVIHVKGYNNVTFKLTGIKLKNGDRKGYMSHATDIRKREDFNEENFSSGGIEFYDQYVADQDGDNGKLDQSNDWDRMYNQVLCYLGDLSDNNYITYQIYDNNNQGTIAEGSVEPFQDQPHDFGGVNNDWGSKNPLPESGCAD